MPVERKRGRYNKPSQKGADSISEPTGSEDPRSLISQYMAAIGRKGGKVGGKRRLQTMSAADRRKAASAAAKARWKKMRKTR